MICHYMIYFINYQSRCFNNLVKVMLTLKKKKTLVVFYNQICGCFACCWLAVTVIYEIFWPAPLARQQFVNKNVCSLCNQIINKKSL